MQKYRNKLLLGTLALIVMSICILITTWLIFTYKDVSTVSIFDKVSNKNNDRKNIVSLVKVSDKIDSLK